MSYRKSKEFKAKFNEMNKTLTEEEMSVDLDTIPFVELHDMLFALGREIGYLEALKDYERREFIGEAELEKLKTTLFADELRKEMQKKNYFAVKTNKGKSQFEIFFEKLTKNKQRQQLEKEENE